ncbi:hypothetical protein ACG83_10930 [Frankia sp. R43]|uniref:hypothetical protein n=1 Tax=Frankia sp. R43 TaxID=269536 RepID=UPI0006CA08EB|nr:hypothetical protein [Frankia sp. R43]KPM55779.1 hypothetical protein ACG83_10930 [Frankia sp. R43]
MFKKTTFSVGDWAGRANDLATEIGRLVANEIREHDRSSCSDDDPRNQYPDPDHGISRCWRCAVLAAGGETESFGLEYPDATVEVDLTAIVNVRAMEPAEIESRNDCQHHTRLGDW